MTSRTLATVPYLPPDSGSGAQLGGSLLQEALTEGPAFARGGRASRWHLVRSAMDYLWEYDGEIHRSLHFWCGAHAHDRSGLMYADAQPDGEPLCGPCHGRREGASPDRPDLLYTPRSGRIPKTCPGSRTMWVEETAWNRGICLVCREPVKLRAGGSFYASTWGAQNHAPGPGLIPACEFHGWRALTQAQDGDGTTVVACRCKCIEAR